MKLEIGYNYNFEVRNYVYASDKIHGIRIAFLSDFHFNGFGENILNHIISTISTLKPDIILLGGDYADSSHGLYYFSAMIKSFSAFENVFAISGNHDLRYMEKIKKIVVEGKIKWVDRESVNLILKGFTIRIDTVPKFANDSRSDFSILCLHKPVDISLFSANYDLVFAGHLHGCQVVFGEDKRGLYPGRLFYRWNRLRIYLGKCQYLISKGLGDTLPIRYNCRRDMILVETVKEL